MVRTRGDHGKEEACMLKQGKQGWLMSIFLIMGEVLGQEQLLKRGTRTKPLEASRVAGAK